MNYKEYIKWRDKTIKELFKKAISIEQISHRLAIDITLVQKKLQKFELITLNKGIEKFTKKKLKIIPKIIIKPMNILDEKNPEDLIKLICKLHRISVDRLKSKNRNKKLVAIRKEVCYNLRRLGLSSPKIGKLLCRDHTSILNLIRKK